MAINNDALYNTALCAFVAAACSGRAFTAAQATSKGAALLAAAQAFATQVDSGIPEDADITTGGGDASCVVGAMDTYTSAMVADAHGKRELLFAICFGLMQGRYTEDTTQADYTVPAAAAANLYNAIVGGITNAA